MRKPLNKGNRFSSSLGSSVQRVDAGWRANVLPGAVAEHGTGLLTYWGPALTRTGRLRYDGGAGGEEKHGLGPESGDRGNLERGHPLPYSERLPKLGAASASTSG